MGRKKADVSGYSRTCASCGMIVRHSMVLIARGCFVRTASVGILGRQLRVRWC